MNDRKTEVERITKHQLRVIEECLTRNTVKTVLEFNFRPTEKTITIMADKGYNFTIYSNSFSSLNLLKDTKQEKTNE